MKKFGPSWYLAGFTKQPIETIREYFGESLGIYFSFVGMPNYHVNFHFGIILYTYVTFRILYSSLSCTGHPRNISVFSVRQLCAIFLCFLRNLDDGTFQYEVSLVRASKFTIF